MRSIVKKENKKAVLSSQVVLIIVALAALVVFTLLGKTMIAVTNAQDIIQKCRLSVSLSSFEWNLDLWLVPDVNLVDSPFKFDCQTIYTEVTPEGIKRAGESVKFGDTDNEKKNQLKDSIMNSMKDCWYMYGEGKVKVHQALEVTDFETACIVCSEMIIDEDFNGGKGLPLNDVYTYAVSTTMPNSDKTYLDYFLEGSTKPEVYPGNEVSDDSLIQIGGNREVDKKYGQYSIVFTVTSTPSPELAGNSLGFPEAGSGIVGCYVGSKGKIEGDFGRKATGCITPGSQNDYNNRLDFGTIVMGNTELAPPASINNLYPVTVRLVPTSELGNSCKRLY